MANRCPSCGGILNFDITKQKLVCEYCESEFDPESIKEMEGAKESEEFGAEEKSGEETMDAKIFTCPNCGAEVFATDLDAVEYCQFCGTFVTLESRLAKLQKPSYILPFTVTKEKCLELYKDKLKKARFLPGDMKAEKAESNFKSTYIPFWVYSEKFNDNANATFHTSESWISGDTEYTQNYNITVKPTGSVDGILFDASATLDDRISAQIGNFSPEDLLPYNASLMAGSYADVADVEKEVYAEDVYEKSNKLIVAQLEKEISSDERCKTAFEHSSSKHSVKATQKGFSYASVDAKLAMLPVWFMTYKNRDRLCYAVVNGNTGKMFTETPSDLKKYTLASIILAIPIFFLLELKFTLLPPHVMILTAIVSLVIFLYRQSALAKLKKQENRVDDKGFQEVFSENAGKTKSGAKNKKLDFTILLFIAAIAVTALVVYLQRPNDILYYLASFVSIVSIFFSLASVVKAHNLSCSRPIPHFIDRKKEA